MCHLSERRVRDVSRFYLQKTKVGSFHNSDGKRFKVEPFQRKLEELGCKFLKFEVPFRYPIGQGKSAGYVSLDWWKKDWTGKIHLASFSYLGVFIPCLNLQCLPLALGTKTKLP